MALYSSSTGSRKSKTLASSSQPESEEISKEASVEGNVTVAEDRALPCTDMCDEELNNDQPHHGTDSSIPGEAGLAKDCGNAEDKVGSDLGHKSLGSNHSESHASNALELQVEGNVEGQLPHDAKALQPCCNPKEEVSGVISDATFASGSQSCEDVMPGCRVNLKRIPCSPGST